ncbi:uncharacterized protein LKV04_004961 [Tautogolabrus adspersus]
MQLQHRWQELKERELKAKHHNRQLLKQFEEAQDALREMLTLTANMKTIRTEYERYLKENSPRWHQQLKKQTQVAQKKRMEEYLRSCLKNTEATKKSSSDQPLPSQGLYAKTQNIAPPQSHNNNNNNLGFNQDGSPHLPFMPSSWLTHPHYQTARFPIRAPYQPQHSPHTPPIYSHLHPFPLPHLASTSGHYSPGWGSLQPDYPWSLTAGAAGLPSDSKALLDQRHTEELPTERGEAQLVEENADTSRSSSSQSGGGGGSRGSHLSQELDVKPVRLSSSHAESSESSRVSDQVSRENRRKKKREKTGRSQSSSSGREAPRSQGASWSSNAIIVAAATASQSSESDASSEKDSNRRTRRSQELAVGSPGAEEVIKEGSSRRKRDDSGSPKEERQSIGEEVESHNEESRSEKADIPESGSQREEESVSVSVKTEKGSLKGADKESDSSEHSSVVENVEPKKDQGDGEDDVEKDNGKTDEEQEERDEDEADEASNIKNTTEEDERGAEDEMEEHDSEEEGGLKNGDDGHRTQGSASSQGEDMDESERGEGKMDEDGESDEGESEEEDQRSDRAGEPEEEGDSEDSIIAPQDNRIKKKIYVIPEAVEDEDEDDEGSISQSPDEGSNSFSDEDIEHLLAPQEQSQKKLEKEKSAGNSDEVIFHVEQCKSPKTDHQSDSDEFDHFYD